MHRQAQLNLQERPTWGGRRAGSGRRPAGDRQRVAHQRRPPHDRHCPVHVTLRTVPGVPSLRSATMYPAIRSAFAAASNARFRLLHFSAQADHVHLLVEADDATALARGLQGLAIRVARSVNRVVGRRGKVWFDRYHARPLRTPREVRHGLVYVLQNWKKHVAGARGIDRCSSGAWFEGWRQRLDAPNGTCAPVASPRTWLARMAWRRHGLIDVTEAPRIAPVSRRRPRLRTKCAEAGSQARRSTTAAVLNSRRAARRGNAH